ncbi:putative late blight resistance protein homolog R1A-10 [Olea europaea var. sylvestris]|uniref:putative late blight resistance protein homolog R1A-10 n=1 Tax=Olea europaea var. sylvestris TaxID=158386 RepID=UPI000C1D5CA4|nr:putative late blight resistance protein homolog R1A-10 [Olea europaea var. sylvestris]
MGMRTDGDSSKKMGSAILIVFLVSAMFHEVPFIIITNYLQDKFKNSMEILLKLLDDIGILTNKIRKGSDEQLKERIYKSLNGQRYLIVMDDVWSTNAWNDIQMLFPDDNNESRILLTTRQTDVADYASSTNNHHLMDFLTEEESWNLFCQKVFGEEYCPPELVNVERNISKNCQGLPLSFVVVAGLLAEENKQLHHWKYVAENLSSIIAKKKDHYSEILTLSYNNLPHRLKPCFLYMGAFPENYEIPVSRLIKLWVAEGFAYPSEAEKYLMILWVEILFWSVKRIR